MAFAVSLPDMPPHDPLLQAALSAAVSQIRATLAAVLGRVVESLGAQSRSSARIAERDLLNTAQIELRRQSDALQRTFERELDRRIQDDLAARSGARRTLAATDWLSLSLVDDGEVEQRMFADRIGQQIGHACESELRDLAPYLSALTGGNKVELERHPLRAELLGAALYAAIETASAEREIRNLLAREIGAALAKAMPECYAQIMRGLQQRGVQPTLMTVRQVEGPGNQLPGLNSGYATLSSTRSQPGDLSDSGHTDHGLGGARGVRPSRGGSPTASLYGGEPSTRSSGPATDPGRAPSSTRRAASHAADAQLTALLRHLSVGASRGVDVATRRAGTTLTGPHGPASRSDAVHALGAFTSSGSVDVGPIDDEGLSGLMAVNLIRAHREELVQASRGKLDHMVIDVVSSLFDQILADSRVPPQMARQIARLQLPVLRVALGDSSFFSSRRHPVRRFVNRIASLACAFDDFSEGPGKQFLQRVSELVQEIIDGDFDQIELYTAKLAALEAFIAEQTHQEVTKVDAVATLGAKETELRLQQRYTMQLQTALAPLALADYLRSFLAEVWSQALVLAVSRDGAQSERTSRYRRVGRDLVMSVQPKGSPALRKKFLMQLPPLMKDLNEGLALVGWPQAAQREFFGKLLPAHADSLKAPPQSELDHNLMAKQLEGIFAAPVPGVESLSVADAVPEVDAEVVAGRFSEEEARRVGLVTEGAVDWSGEVDIPLGDAGPAPTPSQPGDAQALHVGGLDIDLTVGADPAEPTRGANLIDHVKLGFAYQMHLKDEWQKVRLSHVSAGRSFFVFTTGAKHQETISMTARMLARMCATNRFRAVESAYLMERATHRARKQLAALTASSRH